MTLRPEDLARTSVAELARLLARGEASPAALVDLYLQRLEALEPGVGAFVAVYADEARQAARQATEALAQGRRLGPLHGVPFAVKDIVDVAGKFTSYGSRSAAGRQAAESAAYVRALLAAGMILVGKTHTVEFAFGAWGTNQHMGTPRNPLRPDVPTATGGSSSGSGAAVAAGMVPWAVGTDTGGSIRIPSAFCGLTGFRPSVGRYSTEGVMPLSATLDTIGPLAHSAEDVQMLDDAVLGRHGDERAASGPDETPDLRGMRIGVVPDDGLASDEPEVRRAYRESVRAFESLGARIGQVPLPAGLDEFAQLTPGLIACEGHAFAGPYARDPASRMDEEVRARFLAAEGLGPKDHAALLVRRAGMMEAFNRALSGYDVLLTPTTPCVAQPLAALADSPYNPAVYTRFVAWLGYCAIAVPNGTGRHGLPTSLQIIGLPGADRAIMRLARAFQQARRG